MGLGQVAAIYILFAQRAEFWLALIYQVHNATVLVKPKPADIENPFYAKFERLIND
jgi:hypothetical protein